MITTARISAILTYVEHVDVVDKQIKPNSIKKAQCMVLKMLIRIINFEYNLVHQNWENQCQEYCIQNYKKSATKGDIHAIDPPNIDNNVNILIHAFK